MASPRVMITLVITDVGELGWEVTISAYTGTREYHRTAPTLTRAMRDAQDLIEAELWPVSRPPKEGV